jgi:hypothetical protein
MKSTSYAAKLMSFSVSEPHAGKMIMEYQLCSKIHQCLVHELSVEPVQQVNYPQRVTTLCSKIL